MIIDLNERDSFQYRHNSPSKKEIEEMLNALGVSSMKAFIRQTLPLFIRSKKKLSLKINYELKI